LDIKKADKNIRLFYFVELVLEFTFFNFNSFLLLRWFEVSE